MTLRWDLSGPSPRVGNTLPRCMYDSMLMSTTVRCNSDACVYVCIYIYVCVSLTDDVKGCTLQTRANRELVQIHGHSAEFWASLPMSPRDMAPLQSPMDREFRRARAASDIGDASTSVWVTSREH